MSSSATQKQPSPTAVATGEPTRNWFEFGYLRVAAISPKVYLASPAANAAEIAGWCRKAAKEQASLAVFPELCITGYTCEDLFLSSDLCDRAEQALLWLCAETSDLDLVVVVGLPLRSQGRRYNAAAVLQGGRIVGAVPKTHLPNYGEFYERRWFTPGRSVYETIELVGAERVGNHGSGTEAALQSQTFDLTSGAVFDFGRLKLGVEICEDLWSPNPPSSALALCGANVIVNPSASNELVAKASYRRSLVVGQSARLISGYIYAGAAATESTKDIVFGGHTLIAENGVMLTEGERFSFDGTWCISEIDLDRVDGERQRDLTWSNTEVTVQRVEVIGEPLATPLSSLTRRIDANPFVPQDVATRSERASEILAIQSTGLARRVMAAKSSKLVIGVSGGLDSTLALLVSVEAARRLGRTTDCIVGITMPGFGTTGLTKTSAIELMDSLGIAYRTISIEAAARQHLADIGHDPSDFSVTYENAQARERTQILFDVANQVGGIVVGTGDLSELALGWCTFNADHMSNYGVNCGVPKTLVRHLVQWYAETVASERTATVLNTILETPVSPELLPPDASGNIVQHTEDVIGPYELHDFFLWHTLRNGFSPRKVRALCELAFEHKYDSDSVDRWLRMFLTRFYRQQFKRTTLPPGPKVGSVSVSPRGDLRLPDELDPAELLTTF